MYQVRFKVLQADFTNSQNVQMNFGFMSDITHPPKDIELNEEVSTTIQDPKNDNLVITFTDTETYDELCDSFILPTRLIPLDSQFEYEKELKLDDDIVGKVKISIFIGK